VSVVSVGKAYRLNARTGDAVQIGDPADSVFSPKATLSRWNGECSLEFGFDDSKIQTKNVQLTAENRVCWSTPLFDFRFYGVDEGDGELEFEIILKQKPSANVFSFSVQTQHLKFYYQPPLSQELNPAEWDELSETYARKGNRERRRPENIVGSYAVYHAARTNLHRTLGEAEKYKTGKAFHIYRPKLTDAEGKTAWATFNSDLSETGVLTITLPQEFLDPAKYPVTVDPTFGYTTVGASTDGTGEDVETCTSTMTSDSGAQVTSITWYNYTDSGTANFGLALYSDNSGSPNSLLGTTATGSVTTTAQWRTLNFASPISVSPNTVYWLSYAASSLTRYRYDSGATHEHAADTSHAYPTFPDPFNPSPIWDTEKVSIYATYTTGGTVKTVADSLSLSDILLRHKPFMAVTQAVTLSDAVRSNKTLTILEAIGVFDAIRGNKTSLIVADVVSLAELVNVIAGATIKTIMDAIGLTDAARVDKEAFVNDGLSMFEQVFRHKPALSIQDTVGAAETVLVMKLLALADFVSLADVLRALKTLHVTDTLAFVDAVTVPSRFLRALDSVGLDDNATINRVLLVNDNVSLAEIVEFGTSGAKKTKLFLILGDLAVQLSGDLGNS
jgi:hypothetical protein